MEDVGHEQLGLDDVIVVHPVAPEQLLAQEALPVSGDAVRAFDLVVGDDLVPAVFRIAENQRPRLAKRVMRKPQLAPLIHHRARRDLRNLASEPTQHLAILRRKRQIAVVGRVEVDPEIVMLEHFEPPLF